MIHVRMTCTAPIIVDGDSDQGMSFHIPEFEYSNSWFLLIKRIMLERNFNLHTDLQNQMEAFPTPGYFHAELEDLNGVSSSYHYNHKRKRYNDNDDIYSSVNDSLSSASTLSEASSSSYEPPLKKSIVSPFEDMNGHYKALNLNSMSRNNEVKDTQDVIELVTAKLVENYQRSQNIEKPGEFLLLAHC